MSGNNKSNDDLVMGRTNHAQDPTRLIANDKGHSWGKGGGEGDAVVYVSTGGVSPIAIDADGTNLPPLFPDLAAIRARGQQTAILAHCTAANGRAVDASADNGAGVYGTGNPGVHGEALVDPHSPKDDRKYPGVTGNATAGDGVVGSSGSGRGGVFSSETGAQLNLTPLFGNHRLPCVGKLGDMLMFSPLAGAWAENEDLERDGQHLPSLWLCIKSSVGENALHGNAVWARFQFDITYTCQDGVVPASPPPPNRGG